MAAGNSEIRGELKLRDGVTKEVVIKTENNLPSMIAGIKKLSADVSGLLTELVVQEKLCRGSDKGDSQADDDEEEDESDGEEADTKAKKTKPNVAGPPAKRWKTLSS